MAGDKVLRIFHESHQFVIVFGKNGAQKYVSRRWGGREIAGTVKLNEARRFQSEKQARKHMERYFIGGVIIPVMVTMRLEG